MRSWWPIHPAFLDNKRLLAEHNELLIIGMSNAGKTKGWRNHPETLRWAGHSWALQRRHDEIALEMQRRGFNHNSPWPRELINFEDDTAWPGLWEPLEVMAVKLAQKKKATSHRKDARRAR